MYFYQVLHACDDSVLTEEFLKLYTDSPDLNHTLIISKGDEDIL